MVVVVTLLMKFAVMGIVAKVLVCLAVHPTLADVLVLHLKNVVRMVYTVDVVRLNGNVAKVHVFILMISLILVVNCLVVMNVLVLVTGQEQVFVVVQTSKISQTKFVVHLQMENRHVVTEDVVKLIVSITPDRCVNPYRLVKKVTSLMVEVVQIFLVEWVSSHIVKVVGAEDTIGLVPVV